MITALLLLTMQSSAAPSADVRGEWINQRKSAIIRVADCPSGLCGTVVWSAPSAQRDSTRGGTTELNGTIVMFGFVSASKQRWRGKLFLPDLNRTVRATIELGSGGQLRVKGCDVAGLVCRTQTWTRWAAE